MITLDTSIVRLRKSWETDFDSWTNRDLSDKRYAYIWVDGIYFNVRLEDDRCCILVIIGADEAGIKEHLAVEAGYRESTLSWKQILLSLRVRGLDEAPKLAIGDGEKCGLNMINRVKIKRASVPKIRKNRPVLFWNGCYGDYEVAL